MKFEVYYDEERSYRWRLIARNGRVVAKSEQAYADSTLVADAVVRVVEGLRLLIEYGPGVTLELPRGGLGYLRKSKSSGEVKMMKKAP